MIFVVVKNTSFFYPEEAIFCDKYRFAVLIEKLLLLSFVFCSTIKDNMFEHFPHIGTDTVAIVVFEFKCRDVGSGMDY